MTDVDEMQRLIQAANPIADSNQIDPDELARFVAVAHGGKPTLTRRAARKSEVELKTGYGRARLRSRDLRRDYRGWGGQQRGLAVAVRIAALVLLVGAALVLLIRQDRTDSTPPAITETPVVDPRMRSTIELTVDPGSPQVVISTAIGDLEFVALQYEPIGFHLNGGAEATPYGLVTSEHGRLWWSTDFLSWESVVPSIRASGGITVDGEDVIVHGRGAAARFAWDGSAWSEVALVEVAGPEGWMADGVEQMAFASQGAVAVAGNTFFYSPDGTTFVPAAQGPSADRAVGQGDCADLSSHPSFPVQRVLATDSGFVSFAVGHFSDRDDFRCGPLLWTSVDGNIWDVVSGDSPFGEAAVIGEVAERNGRFIATGSTSDSEAALWISDDGLTWAMQALELEAIDGLAAGDLGWVMTGTSHGYAEPTVYFSSDGVTWDGPYPLPPALGAGYLPVQLTVGPDFVMNIDAPALGRLQD